MYRLLLAFATAAAVVLFVSLFVDASDLGGAAGWIVLLVAMIAGSLVDREHFYGVGHDE